MQFIYKKNLLLRELHKHRNTFCSENAIFNVISGDNPEKNPVPLYRRLVEPRDSLDGHGKPGSRWDSIRGLPSPQRVAILTTKFRPLLLCKQSTFSYAYNQDTIDRALWLVCNIFFYEQTSYSYNILTFLTATITYRNLIRQFPSNDNIYVTTYFYNAVFFIH